MPQRFEASYRGSRVVFYLIFFVLFSVALEEFFVSPGNFLLPRNASRLTW